MKKIFKAKIVWLSKEQGGRKTGLPFGNQYGPIIKITKPLQHNSTLWSLFVENKEIVSEYETIAEVNYLSDKAPNNLKINVEFELYEGSKLVARGIIL